MSVKRLGERLKSRRMQLGINQATLAETLGVNQSQISRYELGEIEPHSSALYALALALECSADWLLGLTDEKPPAPD